MKNRLFGANFTKHMFLANYDSVNKWQEGKILPYGALEIMPSASFIHYGQQIFEGLKAFRGIDNKIRLFRVQENAQRFAISAQRMSMPPLAIDYFVDSITRLVKLDQDFVEFCTAQDPEVSLYIRPFMIASQNLLSAQSSQEFLYMVIASPVGSYFASGVKPISVWIEREYVRAFSGGVGFVKCAGNYANSFVALQKAKEHNCDQVVFLDAKTNQNFEELGAMNIFFVKQDCLITPKLNNTILNGITRNSIIQLARDIGLQVKEVDYSPQELIEDLCNGFVTEAFACGTAASVVPIAEFYDDAKRIALPNVGNVVALKLRNMLLDIQYAKCEDKFGWTSIVQ